MAACLRKPQTTSEARANEALRADGIRVRARFLANYYDDLVRGRERPDRYKNHRRG